MFLKLTLEIWAIRRQQHLFSIHKGMLIWTCRSFGESLLLSELTHHLFVPDCGRAVNRRYFWESHHCICRLWIDNCCQGCCTNNNLQYHAKCRSTSRQNGCHFADDLFKCVFLNENVWIAIWISPKFVPKGSINNNPALFQIMAWRRPGDKPLFEPTAVSSLTHIWVTRPQWVKIT